MYTTGNITNYFNWYSSKWKIAITTKKKKNKMFIAWKHGNMCEMPLHVITIAI